MRWDDARGSATSDVRTRLRSMSGSRMQDLGGRGGGKGPRPASRSKGFGLIGTDGVSWVPNLGGQIDD